MNFDLESARRDLIAMRVKHGPNTPKGHACSNLTEQLENLPGYVRPAWATHESQTLQGMMKWQMAALSAPNAEDRGTEAWQTT